MSIQSLPTEIVCHILSFLDIKDHINFSTTCWDNYSAYGIYKINTRKDAKKYINSINHYTVLHEYNNNGGILGMVVGLCTSEYAGSTAYVKDLVVKSYHRYIHGNTIRHTPGSLGGLECTQRKKGGTLRYILLYPPENLRILKIS